MSVNPDDKSFVPDLLGGMYASFFDNLRLETFSGVIGKKNLLSMFKSAPVLDESLIRDEISIIFFRLWQLELESLTKRISAQPLIINKIETLTLRAMFKSFAEDCDAREVFMNKLDDRLENTYVLFSYDVDYNSQEFDDRKAILLRIYADTMRSKFSSIGSKEEVYRRIDNFNARWSWGKSAEVIYSKL